MGYRPRRNPGGSEEVGPLDADKAGKVAVGGDALGSDDEAV